LPVFI